MSRSAVAPLQRAFATIREARALTCPSKVLCYLHLSAGQSLGLLCRACGLGPGLTLPQRKVGAMASDQWVVKDELQYETK
jgi:hypothetical protein